MTTVLLLLALQGTALPSQTPPPAGAPAAAPTRQADGDYQVGPQDQLDINVLPDVFSQKGATVEPDGSFQYLDIARVKAADQTVRQIQSTIKQLLIDRHLHVNPTVTVSVAVYRSQTIYVAGEGVASPRGIQLKGNQTLMEAIYQAGSFTSRAGAYVVVTRRPATAGEAPIEFKIPRRDVQQGTGLAAGFRLQDGDVVTVAEAGRCFVQGEVKNPLTYDITEGKTTVFEVISAAGGFTDKARKGSVKIRRMVDGKLQDVDVDKDLTTIVQAGDVIVVPRRFW